MRSVSLALVAVAGLLAAPTLCYAVPINYVFAPGTSATLNGNVETITGSFTFDTATSTETNVSITLTGAAPFAGTYSTSSFFTNNFTDTIGVPNFSTMPHIDLSFASALNVSPDALTLVQFFGTTFAQDGSPSGSAVFAAVPEPASLAILGTALAGLGLIRCRRRKRV